MPKLGVDNARKMQRIALYTNNGKTDGRFNFFFRENRKESVITTMKRFSREAASAEAFPASHTNGRNNPEKKASGLFCKTLHKLGCRLE